MSKVAVFEWDNMDEEEVDNEMTFEPNNQQQEQQPNSESSRLIPLNKFSYLRNLVGLLDVGHKGAFTSAETLLIFACEFDAATIKPH